MPKHALLHSHLVSHSPNHLRDINTSQPVHTRHNACLLAMSNRLLLSLKVNPEYCWAPNAVATTPRPRRLPGSCCFRFLPSRTLLSTLYIYISRSLPLHSSSSSFLSNTNISLIEVITSAHFSSRCICSREAHSL